MTSEATGDSLSSQTELSADQKKFLTEVLTYYREFAGEKADDEQSRARTAKAASRVGQIEYRLGRTNQGIVAFQMARDGYQTLATTSPPTPAARASCPVIRPCEVEMMATPRPARMRGSSSLPLYWRRPERETRSRRSITGLPS